jgi:hypothetical protein
LIFVLTTICAPLVSANDIQFNYHIQQAHSWQDKADALKDAGGAIYASDRAVYELGQAQVHINY